MKTKKILVPLILALLAFQGIAYATTFTPLGRNSTPFPEEGTAGLRYNSFNNYSGNLALDDPMNGDERKFNVITVCDPICGDSKYTDGWTDLQDGDILEFQIYFHNNAEDPYDGGLTGPTVNAKDIKIGVDLSIPTSENAPNDFGTKPVGFIYAGQNVGYYDNIVAQTNQLKYTANDYAFEYYGTQDPNKIGNNVKTVTDDTTLKATHDFHLEAIPEETNLFMAYNHDGDDIENAADTGAPELDDWAGNPSGLNYYWFDHLPQAQTIINVVVATLTANENITEPIDSDWDYEVFPITAQTVYDADTNRIYITFDEIPGCLRYSGFAYFRAEVVYEPDYEPEITYKHCTDLTLTEPVVIQNTCDLEPKYTNFEVDIDMNDGSISDQYVTFTAGYQGPDIVPKLEITTPFMILNEFTAFPVTIPLSNQDKITGKFYGLGNMTAYFTDKNGATINQIKLIDGEVTNIELGDTSCIATLDVCDNTCEDICVEHPEQIPVGSISEFSAETLAYNGNPWNNEILYEVKDVNDGEFFASKEDLLEKYPNAYDNPFNQIECDGMNELTLFIKNIIANLPAKSTSKNSNFLASVLLADIGIDIGKIPIEPNTVNNFQKIDQVDVGFSIDTIDIPEELQPPCDPTPTNGIKAYQGDTVYFYAKHTGIDKIKVSGECTDEQDCEQEFDIIAPPTCSNVDYSYINGGNEALACVKENTPVIITASNITMSVGDITFPAPQGSVTFDWYSDPAGIGLFSGENPLTTQQTAVQYISPENTNIFGYLSKFSSTNYTEDQLVQACKFSLPACPDEPPPEEQVCNALTYEVTSYLGNLPMGQVTSLPSEDIYIFESSLDYTPPENQPTRVDYETTSQYGRFAVEQDFTIPIVELPLTIPEPVENWSTQKLATPVTTKVYFYPMQNLAPGTHTNKITLQATSSNPLTEPGCIKYLSIVVPAEDACQNIALHADPSWPPASTPDSTRFYITGDLGDYDGDFRFNLTAANDSHLSLDDTADENGETTLIVSDSKAFNGVYMFGPTLQTDWVVQVRANDEGADTACVSQLTYTPEPYNPPPPPPPKKPKCEELKIIKPGSNWNLDPDEDEEDFEVEVEGTPSDHDWTINWTIPTNPEGIANFNHETSTSYTNILKNPYEGITVFIKVDGTDPGVCEATISPKITEKIDASIKKRVRPGDFGNDPGDSDYGEDWDDLINISAKDKGENGETILPEDSKYVTYRIDFKPGNGKGVSSALIQETEFEDGVLEGSKGGELVFEDNLWIEVYFDNDPDEAYLNEDDDDLEICEYDGNDLETTEVCVTNKDFDANDLDDLAEAFADANEGLVFNNIEGVYKIKIYYEMKNETTLNQETCQELNAETDGCGEQFPNEIEFETYKDNDLEGDDVDSDNDDAMVVAICPFILTRAGGDVFFSSELTSGIDVAYCSEQKNIQGPSITPIKIEEEVKQEVPKTGAGDLSDQAYLTTPTHDICKYSNVEGASSGVFDNPLKNFSSTICEMKAEVAEGWQQEYIVNQINKNISNLSRWHETLITNQFPPSTNTNIYSYTNKDITIPGLTISDPAAQTYIIKGGDLNITGNIKYQAIDVFGPLNPKNVPSAAFIVIDGDINIAPGVTQLDGVYITIDTDGTNDGKVTSQGFSYNPLTFNGILIGNVADLFSKRRYSGSVSMEQGSVTIKFSQNFLLNTPPGLSDLLDLTQLKVAF